MEQEVLKSFISGNPLDGLYPYIKKYSFLNQVKSAENLPKFIIIWYVKEVQRAKKKWFFIKIEDISGDREFFSREQLDFKKFNLIILHGSKINGRVYIDKIIKTEYETLTKLAGGKFDPERTVVRAKKERYWEQKTQEIEKIKSEQVQISPAWSQSDSNPDEEIDDAQMQLDNELLQEENYDADEFDEQKQKPEISVNNNANSLDPEETDRWEAIIEATEKQSSKAEPETKDIISAPIVSNEGKQNFAFELKSLPENLEKITLLTEVLKEYPGEITILILGEKKKINKNGLNLLKTHFLI